MVERPRILSISFSPLRTDARVLRQLRLLAEFGDVISLGFGEAPDGVAEHIEIPAAASLPQTVGGVAKLALRRFRAAELDAPAIRAAGSALAGRRFDLVVANEARALPIAFAVAGDAPVWGDMHEWAPEERTHVLSWRLLVAPFMTWVCARYLPRCAAVTTVGGAIAGLYEQRFGVPAEVVRNSIALQELSPSPLEEGRIRLVHSGAAVPGRNIEALIAGTLDADPRFTLDLYLVRGGDGGAYWEKLRSLAAGSDRIAFHDAVRPHELPATLNAYDVGVYSVPLITTNHRYMLPNKFFDFVQARLAVVFSPSEEIDALIARLGIGVTSADASAAALTRTLESLTSEAVAGYKRNSDVAARGELNATADDAVVRGILGRLLG
jgi:glycosyltransferase involved in cell wall biosynthesis